MIWWGKGALKWIFLIFMSKNECYEFYEHCEKFIYFWELLGFMVMKRRINEFIWIWSEWWYMVVVVQFSKLSGGLAKRIVNLFCLFCLWFLSLSMLVMRLLLSFIILLCIFRNLWYMISVVCCMLRAVCMSMFFMNSFHLIQCICLRALFCNFWALSSPSLGGYMIAEGEKRSWGRQRVLKSLSCIFVSRMLNLFNLDKVYLARAFLSLICCFNVSFWSNVTPSIFVCCL